MKKQRNKILNKLFGKQEKKINYKNWIRNSIKMYNNIKN
jgi:hypothetical protein